MMEPTPTTEAITRAPCFDDFVLNDGQRLRRALVARWGVEVGNDLHAEAMARVWEDWDRVGAMTNPIGFAYRIAQSASRRHTRWARRIVLPQEDFDDADEDDGRDIFLSLGALRPLQRSCVVLVHAHGWSYQEVADTLGITVTAVTNHVHRGMRRLRREFGGPR